MYHFNHVCVCGSVALSAFTLSVTITAIHLRNFFIFPIETLYPLNTNPLIFNLPPDSAFANHHSILLLYAFEPSIYLI